MFESDQSDLHEEIAELKQSTAAAVKSRTEVHDTSFYEAEEEEEDAESNFPVEKEETKKKQFPYMLFAFGAVAIMVVALLYLSKPKKADEAMPGDLGPGVSAQAGIRGHLVTQWDGNSKAGKLRYQLRLEPIGPVQAPGFAKVNENPLAPYSINMRILDQAGFALCGKEILFRFDPQSAPLNIPVEAHPGKKGEAARAAAQAARKAELDSMVAAEAERERGKDIFQNQAGPDSVVTAVNTQGTLPCSPDQYKRAYYWDFTTNFPTVDEQFAMVDPKAAAAAKREKESGDRSESRDSHRRSSSRKPLSAYYIQGDDRVTGYDPAHGVLEATAGRSFTIPNKPEQTIAANWAHSYSLIHYKCDQHASCALTSAGGMSVVYARINE
jgi:hypothetical protein